MTECLEAVEDRRTKASKEAPPPILEYYRPWIEEAMAPEVGLFQPIRCPRHGDWLTQHEERGQPFKTFVRGMHFSPHGPFRSIAIVPLGNEFELPSLQHLVGYLKAFFCLQVRVLPRVPLDTLLAAVTHRDSRDRKGRQLLSKDVHRFLGCLITGSRDYSRSTVATVGVTMEDLYPQDDWNFVFGEADLSTGVGVFSFCRYSPVFFDPFADPAPELVLQRACKVMTHEICHMFGLRHCIHFSCLMNGSNHLDELDANGLWLCPVCLFKLIDGFRWNLVSRYTGLLCCAEQLGCFPTPALEQLRLLVESATSFQVAAGSPPGAVDWCAEFAITRGTRK